MRGGQKDMDWAKRTRRMNYQGWEIVCWLFVGRHRVDRAINRPTDLTHQSHHACVYCGYLTIDVGWLEKHDMILLHVEVTVSFLLKGGLPQTSVEDRQILLFMCIHDVGVSFSSLVLKTILGIFQLSTAVPPPRVSFLRVFQSIPHHFSISLSLSHPCL